MQTKVDNFFSPVWNQNPEKDTLYVCVGPSFNAKQKLDICAIKNVSSGRQQRQTLTSKANNAFPSTNPDGKSYLFILINSFQIQLIQLWYKIIGKVSNLTAVHSSTHNIMINT